MPSGGEPQGNDRLGVHMVASAVGAHVVDGRQQLPLGDGPPGLGGHMVVQQEHRVAQPGKAQGHRLALPVGAVLVAAAGADDQRRAGAEAQFRKTVGNIGDQPGGLRPAGHGQQNGFMEHKRSPFCMYGL